MIDFHTDKLQPKENMTVNDFPERRRLLLFVIIVVINVCAKLLRPPYIEITLFTNLNFSALKQLHQEYCKVMFAAFMLLSLISEVMEEY